MRQILDSSRQLLNLMKIGKSYPNVQKTLREKEELLVTFPTEFSRNCRHVKIRAYLGKG